MQYVGGKWKAGKRYAAMIAPKGPWWEPFCGGLNVTMHLAKSPYKGLVSDINEDLIGLFKAVRGGWKPPVNVTRDEYYAAKESPSSPLRTFIGFGCSFSGKWFGGYAKNGTFTYKSSGQTQTRNYAAEFAKALLLQVEATRHCEMRAMSFIEMIPRKSIFEVIYCDPPYEGTLGYKGRPFDHDLFWSRCVEWAKKGTRVLVSEYTCPVDHSVIWKRTRKCQISKDEREEHVFAVSA